MGFLDRLRASQSAGMSDWKAFTDINQFADIEERSKERPVVIFKHSTSCGISAGAKHRLESDWPDIEGDLEFYYLDLLAYRPISNEIANRYGVRHESPQIIVIKDGKAIYNTSHHRISVGDLNKSLG